MGRCKEERPGMFPHPAPPFSSHSLRRSGRSSALPYPPSEQDDNNRFLYLFKVDTGAYSMHDNGIKNGGELACQSL